jgi:hypothetical protein
MVKRKPHVTDHALRRFLERVRGVKIDGAHDGDALKALEAAGAVDLNSVSSEVRKIIERGAAAGACAVLLDGRRYILRNRTLTTVMAVSKRKRRRRPLRGEDQAD